MTSLTSSEMEQRSSSGKAAVVIVLGAAVWEGGIASPSLRRRAIHGARLILAGHADTLIASGGVGQHPPSEAFVIRSLALAEGVAPQDIILDEKSTSTLTSAINCASILRSMNWSSAIVVSDQYHMFRAVFLLRRLGVAASPSAADSYGAGTPRLRWYWLHIREFLAIPWSWIRVSVYLWNSRNRP